MDRRVFLTLLSAALGAKPPSIASLPTPIPTPFTKPGDLRCSFCNRSQRETRTMIAGPGCYICNECICLCTELIREEAGVALGRSPVDALPDTASVEAELDAALAEVGIDREAEIRRSFEETEARAQRVPATVPRVEAVRAEIEAHLRAAGTGDLSGEEFRRYVEALGRVHDELSSELADPKPFVGLVCSFCGKAQAEVKKLIAGPTVYVCNECVELCNDIIAEDGLT